MAMSASTSTYPRCRARRLSRLPAALLATAVLAAALVAAAEAVMQRQDLAARDRELHDAIASAAAGRYLDLFATRH